MSADRDDEIRDQVLRRVVDDLRRPVAVDPAVDQRVLELIRTESVTGPAVHRFPRGRTLWLGGAAVAAGVLLAVWARAPEKPPSVAAPAPVTAVSDQSGTRPVLLRLAAPASSRVSVVGDFNDWDPGATPLRPGGETGTWVVELHLRPGRYRYTFLIDGQRWARDPTEPPAPETDFDAPVSVLTVG